MQKYYTHKINNFLVIKKIVTIHYQEIDSDYCFAGETHDFWEIAYVDKNEVIYTINDKEINVKEKEMIFIKPNSFHSLKCKKNTNLFIISFECKSSCMTYFENKTMHLNDYFISILSKIISEAKSTFYLPSFDPLLNKLSLLDNPLLGGEQLIKNYLEIFLISLLRNEANKASSDVVFMLKSKTELSFIEQIIKYLNDNIYKKITLNDMCKETKYCKTYICTNFKKEMKMSIMSYFMGLKIKEAKKLIKENKTFNEISILLNFDTPSHFTNTFKKYTNMTPSQYKNSIIK